MDELDNKITQTEQKIARIKRLVSALEALEADLAALKRARSLLAPSDTSQNGNSSSKSRQSVADLAEEFMKGFSNDRLHIDSLFLGITQSGHSVKKESLAAAMYRESGPGKRFVAYGKSTFGLTSKASAMEDGLWTDKEPPEEYRI